MNIEDLIRDITSYIYAKYNLHIAAGLLASPGSLYGSLVVRWTQNGRPHQLSINEEPAGYHENAVLRQAAFRHIIISRLEHDINAAQINMNGVSRDDYLTATAYAMQSAQYAGSTQMPSELKLNKSKLNKTLLLC